MYRKPGINIPIDSAICSEDEIVKYQNEIVENLEDFNIITKCAKILSDKTRSNITYLLYTHNELCIADINRILGLKSSTAIYKGLSKMYDYGFVWKRTDKQTVFTKLTDYKIGTFLLKEIFNKFDYQKGKCHRFSDEKLTLIQEDLAINFDNNNTTEFAKILMDIGRCKILYALHKYGELGIKDIEKIIKCNCSLPQHILKLSSKKLISKRKNKHIVFHKLSNELFINYLKRIFINFTD